MTDIITPAQWTYNYPNAYYILVNNINFFYEGAFRPYSISAPDSNTVRFELHPGDQYAYDISRYKSSERDEIAAVNNVAANLQPLEISYGLTIEPGVVSTADYLVLGQIHQNLADTTATGGPVMEVDLASGDILAINARYTDAAGVLHSYALYRSPAPIVRGHHYNIDIKFVADPTGNGGRLVVTIDGQAVVDYRGKLGDPNMQGVYWAEGIYRAATAAQTIAADFSNLQITTGASVVMPPAVTAATVALASDGTGSVTLSEVATPNATLSVYDAGKLVGSTSVDSNGQAQLTITGLGAGLHQLGSQTTDPTSGTVGPMSGSADILVATAAQLVQMLPVLAADYNLLAIQLTDTQTLPIGSSSALAGTLAYAGVLQKINGTVLLQTTDKFSSGAFDTEIKTYSLANVLLEDKRSLSGKVVLDTIYSGSTTTSTSYASDGSYTTTIVVNGQTVSASNRSSTGQLNWSEAVFQDGSREYDYFSTSGAVTKSSVYQADGTRVDVTYNTSGASYPKVFNYTNAAGKTVLSAQYDANGRLISNTSTAASGSTIITYQYNTNGVLTTATIQKPDSTRSITTYGSDGVSVVRTSYYSSSNALTSTDTSNPAASVPSITSVVANGAGLKPAIQAGPESTLANGSISISLRGTASAGSSISLYDGSALASTATADATGHVSFILANVTTGVHQYSAAGEDTKGASYSLGAVSVDAEPITVSIASAGGPTNVASQMVSGIGQAGTSITLFDGTLAVASAAVASNGTWQSTISLASRQGAHSISAVDTDAYGNTGLSSTVTYTYDTTPPKVTIAAPGGLVGIVGQSITGTGEAGTTINVYDGTLLVGTTTVIGSGFWRVPITLSGDGNHSISAVDTDAAGNASTSPTVVYTLDTTPPTAAVTSQGGFTNYPVQTISGNGEAGTAISVYDNAKLAGTTTVASDGTWSASITMNGNYQHSVYALDKDKAGNVGSSRSVLYNLSTVSISNSGGLTNNPSQSISGGGEPGAAVTLFDGTTAIASTTISSAGTWSVSISLSGDGVHRFYAQDTDSGNNIGFSNVVYLTLDTTAPIVAVGSTGGLTNQSLQTISGTGEAGTSLTLYDDGAPSTSIIVNPDGTWSASVSLSGDGTHMFQALDTDAAGNIGSSNSITFTLDTTPPAVAIGSAGGLTNQPSQIVNGTGEAGTSLTLLDNGVALASTIVNADGTWSASVGLNGDGTHTIQALDTDAAGNVGSSSSVSYTLDTTAPVVAIGSTAGLTNQPSQNVSGTGEAGTSLTILDNGAASTSTIVNADGTWSAAVALSGDGTHTIQALDTDAAGNVGRSGSIAFTLDTTPPVVAIQSKGGLTVQASQTVSGTGEAGTSVAVYDGTTALGNTVAGADGTWAVSIVLNGIGTHKLVSQDIDAAGNVGSSAPVSYTLLYSSTIVNSDGSSTVSTYQPGSTSLLLSVVSLNAAGTPTQNDLYDGGGRRISSDVFGGNGGDTLTTFDPATQIAIGSTQTKADGSKIVTTFQAGSSTVAASIQTYTAVGIITMSQTFDSAGRQIEIDSYNSTGVEISSNQRFADGSRISTNYDPSSGAVLQSSTVRADGSHTDVNNAIVGKPYTAQVTTYNSSGAVTLMNRYYGDAARTPALSSVTNADGSSAVYNYDTSGRETSRTITAADGSKQIVNSTYTGVSSTPSTVAAYQYAAGNTLVAINTTNADGTHTQVAKASAVSLTSTTAVADTFTSASGGGDTFVFQPSFGQDLITNFHAASGQGFTHDTVQFDTSVVPDYQHLQISQTKAGALITVDAANTILLKGVSASSLTSSDFSFKPHAAGV